MTATQLESLKSDFLEWTGGFEPESHEDIARYIDTSMPFDYDKAEALKVLSAWMKEAATSR